MSTTINQDNSFYEAMMPNKRDFLESAIAWIKANLEPTDVFSDEELGAWAADNGFAKEEA